MKRAMTKTAARVEYYRAVCFHATARPGTPRPDNLETAEARWWPVHDLDRLPMQFPIRCRLNDTLFAPEHVYVG